MMTVLPTPAPPKMPILPPFLNGQIRSMTFRPGLEDLDLGRLLVERGRVAVDRQRDLGDDGALAVDRVAEDVEHATERRLADRHRDRRAGVTDVDAAGETVRGRHRDGADPVVAEVLLDLADERLQALALDLDGVVDARQLAGRELDVHDGSGDLDDSAESRPMWRWSCRLVPPASLQRQRAFAPDAISIISRVMFAWRTLLYERVRSSMSSSAFSVAFFIATIRLDSSLAFASRTAWNRRVAT